MATKATKKTEEKVTKKKAYKLNTRVQKRIIAIILGEIQDMIEAGNTLSDGKTLSNQALAALSYKWAGFLLESYQGMPKPEMVDFMGIETLQADAGWIAENLLPTDVYMIFNEGISANTVSDDEKKD